MYHSKTALAAGLTSISSGLLLITIYAAQSFLQLLELPAYADVAFSLDLDTLAPVLFFYGIGFVLCWVGFGTRSRICLTLAAVAYCFAIVFALFEILAMTAIFIPALLSFLASLRRTEGNVCDWLGYHGPLEDYIDDDHDATPKP